MAERDDYFATDSGLRVKVDGRWVTQKEWEEEQARSDGAAEPESPAAG